MRWRKHISDALSVRNKQCRPERRLRRQLRPETRSDKVALLILFQLQHGRWEAIGWIGMNPDKPLFRGFLDRDCRDKFLDSDGRREILSESEGGKVERIGLRLGHVGPGHRQAVYTTVGACLAVGLDVWTGLDVGHVLAEREAVLTGEGAAIQT